MSRQHEPTEALIEQLDEQPSPMENEGTNDDTPEQESLKPFPNTCNACLDVLGTNDAIHGRCFHAWCRECLSDRFAMAVRLPSMFPAQCCGKTILHVNATHHDNSPLIKPEIWDLYQKKLEEDRKRRWMREEELRTANPTFCSKRECSEFIPVENIQHGMARCSYGHITCGHCKAEAHTGECDPDPDTEGFLNLARENGWQKCPHCKSMIERTDGCNEMSKSNMSSQPRW